MKRSVDYPTYEGKYDEGIKNMMAKNPNQIDEETMRANLYGYTYTEEYAKGEIPNEFSMDYWKELFFEGVFPLEEMGICMDFENRPDVDDEDSSIYDDDSPIYDVLMPQEEIILKAIDSTGDGKSAETALCVIDVSQEYEYIRRVFPYSDLMIEKQSVRDGIDCISFKSNIFGIEKLYFDISRRFEVGYGV